MKRAVMALAVPLAVGALLGRAQSSGPARAIGIPQKQIDIGAADAPLNDAQRADLDRAVRKHDYAAEKAVLDKALTDHPGSFELLAMWGRLAYLEKHPDDSAQALERADKIKPLSEADRVTLAMAYQFSDEKEKARAELLKLVKAAPRNAEYLYLLGRIESHNVKLVKAAEYLTRAIQLDPAFIKAYAELGHVQEQMGRQDEARKAYEAAVEVNRRLSVHSEEAPLDLGILLYNADDFAGAEKLFRESLQYNPRYAWGHYYLGQVFHHQARNDEAMAEYKAAVIDDRWLTPAWLALAREFKREGNTAQADYARAMVQKLTNEANARAVKAR